MMEKIEGSIHRGCPAIGVDTSKSITHGKGTCCKLDVYNWLEDISADENKFDVLEIRFKNTHKGFYINTNRLRLQVGDIVAVEANPGHDIGVVSMVGPLVMEQMKRNAKQVDKNELKKVYRKAKPADIDKWLEAVSLEHETMLNSRQITQELELDMKIGDVEYQGDRTKAIFYYIADERVDFRQLIKILADRFKIRIEMRQIGARQEAGRIGGIGACGRELCCCTWLTNFVSVSTNAARYQEVSLNPQKLAGQCSKLKCCLNFEIDCYIDAQRDFPKSNITLETKEGTAYHQKTDIFKRIMWYSFDQNSTLNLKPVPVDRVKEIIELNKTGEKPDNIEVKGAKIVKDTEIFNDFVSTEENIDRFKNQGNKKKRNKQKSRNRKYRNVSKSQQ